MDERPIVPFLRIAMLVTDGVGIFASYTISQYYRPSTTERYGPVFLLYVFFFVLSMVFVALTISDALVIAKVPESWATLPIVRGLSFRVPLTVVELWMIHKQHDR